jgi:hypothetical protein
VPSPHRLRLSNTSSRPNPQSCVPRQEPLSAGAGRAGPVGAMLPPIPGHSLRQASAPGRSRGHGRIEGLVRRVPLCVIPEGAGTVNPYDEGRPWCCVAFPLYRRAAVSPPTGQWWSARSAARTNGLGVVKG